MKPESSRLHAKDYIRGLAAAGRYHFASGDARKALGVSADAARLALNRLARQNMIAQPARGFYVIVPPEYRSLECLPADQFIPALMQRLEQPYYAGLLSAAQYHGAAHHRPQEFQVLLDKARRPIHCGRMRVTFSVRKHLRNVPVQSLNTPRGTIRVSTPEATAVDLVGYYRRVGGLDHVATILSELVERIDPQKLVTASQTAPITWAQRLGYLLALADAREQATLLQAYVRDEARQTVGAYVLDYSVKYISTIVSDPLLPVQVKRLTQSGDLIRPTRAVGEYPQGGVEAVTVLAHLAAIERSLAGRVAVPETSPSSSHSWPII